MTAPPRACVERGGQQGQGALGGGERARRVASAEAHDGGQGGELPLQGRALGRRGRPGRRPAAPAPAATRAGSASYRPRRCAIQARATASAGRRAASGGSRSSQRSSAGHGRLQRGVGVALHQRRRRPGVPGGQEVVDALLDHPRAGEPGPGAGVQRPRGRRPRRRPAAGRSRRSRNSGW